MFFCYKLNIASRKYTKYVMIAIKKTLFFFYKNIFQTEIQKVKINNTIKYIRIQQYNISPIITTVLPIVAPLSILVIALIVSIFVGRKKTEPNQDDNTQTKPLINNLNNKTQTNLQNVKQTNPNIQNQDTNQNLSNQYCQAQKNKNNQYAHLNLRSEEQEKFKQK